MYDTIELVSSDDGDGRADVRLTLRDPEVESLAASLPPWLPLKTRFDNARCRRENYRCTTQL